MSALRQLLAIMSAVPSVPPRPRVMFRPELLMRSSQLIGASIPQAGFGPRPPEPVLIAWSPEALHLRAHGVRWHDEKAEHCRTWTDGAGCRCDLGDEA